MEMLRRRLKKQCEYKNRNIRQFIGAIQKWQMHCMKWFIEFSGHIFSQPGCREYYHIKNLKKKFAELYATT